MYYLLTFVSKGQQYARQQARHAILLAAASFLELGWDDRHGLTSSCWYCCLQVERLEGILAEKDAELAGAGSSSSDLQQELREVRSHCELLEADVEHLQQEARQRKLSSGSAAALARPGDQQLPEQVPKVLGKTAGMD